MFMKIKAETFSLVFDKKLSENCFFTSYLKVNCGEFVDYVNVKSKKVKII